MKYLIRFNENVDIEADEKYLLQQANDFLIDLLDMGINLDSNYHNNIIRIYLWRIDDVCFTNEILERIESFIKLVSDEFNNITSVISKIGPNKSPQHGCGNKFINNFDKSIILNFEADFIRINFTKKPIY